MITLAHTEIYFNLSYTIKKDPLSIFLLMIMVL